MGDKSFAINSIMYAGPASLYDGSLCNYRLSPMSNMSIYFEKEGPTAPSMNILKQDDKNQSNKMSRMRLFRFRCSTSITSRLYVGF